LGWITIEPLKLIGLEMKDAAGRQWYWTTQSASKSVTLVLLKDKHDDRNMKYIWNHAEHGNKMK